MDTLASFLLAGKYHCTKGGAKTIIQKIIKEEEEGKLVTLLSGTIEGLDGQPLRRRKLQKVSLRTIRKTSSHIAIDLVV